jgi:small subunit ribosomal protein S7
MRRKKVYKRYYKQDVKFQSVLVGRFINYLMYDGKKSIAEKVFYDAMDMIKQTTKQDPLKVFEQALENVTPLMEVTSRRIGGANYQVPQEVRPERKFMLATKWLIGASRAKKGMPMSKRLAEELIAAAKNEGSAIKKKQDTHRMAEANRAFAHFARR